MLRLVVAWYGILVVSNMNGMITLENAVKSVYVRITRLLGARHH
jgi:hypothetical protein